MNNQTNTSGRETADERLERYAREMDGATSSTEHNRMRSEQYSKETGHDVEFYEGEHFSYSIKPKGTTKPHLGYSVYIEDAETSETQPDCGIIFKTRSAAITHANKRADEVCKCRVSEASRYDIERWEKKQERLNRSSIRKAWDKCGDAIVFWLSLIAVVTVFSLAVIDAKRANAQEVVCAYGTIGCIARYSSPSIDTTPQYNITPPSQLYGPSLDGNADDFFGTPGLKPLNEVHDDWCRSDPDYYGC